MWCHGCIFVQQVGGIEAALMAALLLPPERFLSFFVGFCGALSSRAWRRKTSQTSSMERVDWAHQHHHHHHHHCHNLLCLKWMSKEVRNFSYRINLPSYPKPKKTGKLRSERYEVDGRGAFQWKSQQSIHCTSRPTVYSQYIFIISRPGKANIASISPL